MLTASLRSFYTAAQRALADAGRLTELSRSFTAQCEVPPRRSSALGDWEVRFESRVRSAAAVYCECPALVELDQSQVWQSQSQIRVRVDSSVVESNHTSPFSVALVARC